MAEEKNNVLVECDYEFETLLDRAYEVLDEKTAGIKKKILFKGPIVKIENRKTYIMNFIEMSKSLNRDSDEIKKYIEDELKITSSVTEEGKLKINAVLTTKLVSFERLVAKFIDTYMVCSNCKSANTKEETANRIRFIICNVCRAKSAINLKN